MKKKINKFLFMVLLSVAMVVSAGIFSFSNNYKTAYASDNNGGGLYVGNNSVFNMTKGKISDYETTECGGGVYVAVGGTFNFSGGEISGNSATNGGDNIYNAGTFTMTGGQVGITNSASIQEGIYNDGTMNLYGGHVYDMIYSSTSFNTKMAATLHEEISIADSATITVQDYAGTTPTYKIKLTNSRPSGTIVTFKGNTTTSPDISKFTVTGYNSDYDIVIRKNSNGYFELALTTIELPSTWKTEIASTTYMTTTVTPANITKIQFVAIVPSGYTKIGTLSTGLPVYRGTTATEIAFVAKSIYAPVDSSSLFYNLSKLTTLDMSIFATSNVTDVRYMFCNCSSLTSLDLSNFDTSKVTNMNSMFSGCSALSTLNISSFNTSNVTYMGLMFYNCKALTSLDVSGFNTSIVTSMSAMFSNCSSLTSLEVSSFNTTKVTNMNGMFSGCSGLTVLDVSNLNTSKVTNMGSMFSECSSLTQINVSNFNTSKVENMNGLFNRCYKLKTIDISNFNGSSLTDISQMFGICEQLTSITFGNFNTSNVVNMENLFWNCKSIETIDLSKFNTSKTTDMSAMFWQCYALKSVDLSSFNTSKVTDMSSMFYNCSSLSALSLSTFVTSKVTNMNSMFEGCSALSTLNISSFNTANVTSMSSMFQGCKNLMSLDLSHFNTAKVTNMSSMFQGCNLLVRLNISSFDMSKVTSSSNMLNFGTSTALKYIKTPYKNSTAIAITTGSTLYNVSTETVATGVLANSTSSQTLSIRFTLNLAANGGSCSVSSLVAYYYCSLTNVGKSLPTATQSGYTFSGWYTERTGGTRIYDSTTLQYTTTTTLYAHWTENTPTPDPDPPTPPDPDPDPPTPTDSDIEQAKYIIFTTRRGVPSGLDLNASYDYSSRTFFQSGTTPDVYTNDSGTQVAFVGDYGDLIAPQDCSNMFAGMQSLKWVIFRNYDTFNSTSFTSMFEGCGSLEFVDMLSIQTPQVESMRSMFKDCEYLRQIALADFDCISLSDASYMFSGCSSLGNNPLYSGSSGNIHMQNEQLGSVPEIKYTYNLTNADYMFAGCGWGTFCMPYLFTDSLSSAGGMFENSTFTALDLSQFLCNGYDFSDICGETQLSVEAISTPRGCNPNNFINSNFNGTYNFANNDTINVFDQAGIENLVIPFSLCLVSSDASGNYEQITYTVKIPEYRDSEIEYLIEKFCQCNVMFTGSKNDFNFQTYHISYNDIYYIIPHPTGDYDETGSEEGSFAGLIGNIGALKDDLVYGDFLNRWAWSTNPNNVEVITWHDDEIPAITIDSNGGDIFCGTTPYQNWYEGPRHLFARVRYLPSVHFTDGRLLVGWTDALDMGVNVTYFTNIARLENSSSGDWWENGLTVITKSVDNYIGNEYWRLPTATTFLQSKEESVNDLMQLYDENKQDVLIPEDKKVTITELKIDKIA